MRMNPLWALLIGLAVSCSGTSGTDMPQWRWDDTSIPDEEQYTESNPDMIAAGWTNVHGSYAELPKGISVYRSPETLAGVKAVAYAALADPALITWDVRSIDDPSISGTTDPLMTPAQYYDETGAPIVVNGGYFFSENGKNYNASVAVSGGRTYGVNINYASQDWETMYYPTRAVLYEKDGTVSAGWTYWSGGARHYLYGEPAMNSWSKDPLQVPDASFPAEAADFAPLTAIGGGPVLVKGGQVVDSWEAELFYGSGADDKMPLDRHPRTAIGVRSDGRIVLLVCEGRGMTEGVAGLSTGELASVMKDLGCSEAVNLDGGGSSCMLVQGMETIKVSDGKQRAVGSVVILKEK